MQADKHFMFFELTLAQSMDDSPSQTPPHFSRSAGQFRQSLDNISNRINVIDICPFYLFLLGLYLLVLDHIYSNLLEIQSISGGISSNCKQNSIELLCRSYFISLLILYDDTVFSVLILVNFDGEGCFYDIDLPPPEILQDIVDHVSIKSPQIVTSGHQTHIIAHSLQKSSYFHCHIPSSHDQCLPWRCLFQEDIITGDGMMRSLDFQIGGSCPSRNQKVAGLYLIIQRGVMVILWQVSTIDVFLDQFGIFGADDGVLVLKGGKTVEVVQFIQSINIGDIAKINRLYIALDLIPELCPIEPFVQLFQLAAVSQLIQFPSIVPSVYYLFMAFGSLMHELFGNASYVHTGPSNAPLRLMMRFLHEVYDDHLQAVLVCLEGSCQSTRASSDHCQIIEAFIGLRGC